ncbi:secretory phospholipase A2 receptor [Etheostoma spectabile]|uniref:C-type lectin domain-containing protein n=1 Tax=Etheostoma spectabile TaxID=54343 RepID=A0A5J5CPK5_9PERO|nr:secretory phospholipase A2 receptor-like [Etheostoma spectabile]KAA8582809.1 hypothetical protein FQN60_006480 [Etheostoma spectabile]
MERVWVVVLYLSGWKISTCLLHQYHFVANEKTWAEAQAYCRETHTDLATIRNSEEMNQLISTVESFGYHSEVWIGLYSTIDWRWSDGYRKRGTEFRNWQNRTDNEPDFYSANQFCVCIDNNGWWDDDCKKALQFICYRGTQLNPEYVVVNEKMNWSSAQRYCRENFTDLATVRNDTENQKVQSLVPNGYWAWIGLFRDPNIYWSDGSGYSFSYWSTGSFAIGSTRACGLAALQRTGKWMTKSCETRLPYVCYSVPPPARVIRQTIQLRVKPGDPSLELNDLAVQADIQKKLQGKLKVVGMSGVTLKWKEQPDGKVFHKEGQSSQKKFKKKTEL